jgi:ABC-type Co2+ transport system permease subunit
MHIGSGFLSPPVWGTMAAASGAALAASLAIAGRRLDERKVPLMGVMGAFVFAAFQGRAVTWAGDCWWGSFSARRSGSS